MKLLEATLNLFQSRMTEGFEFTINSYLFLCMRNAGCEECKAQKNITHPMAWKTRLLQVTEVLVGRRRTSRDLHRWGLGFALSKGQET